MNSKWTFMGFRFNLLAIFILLVACNNNKEIASIGFEDLDNYAKMVFDKPFHNNSVIIVLNEATCNTSYPLVVQLIKMNKARSYVIFNTPYSNVSPVLKKIVAEAQKNNFEVVIDKQRLFNRIYPVMFYPIIFRFDNSIGSSEIFEINGSGIKKIIKTFF